MTNYGPAKVDLVNQPPHYKAGGMEAIDVIEAFAPGNFHRGNALKYLLRADKKGATVQDLRKAIWYIEREITKAAPLSPIFGERMDAIEERLPHECPDLDHGASDDHMTYPEEVPVPEWKKADDAQHAAFGRSDLGRRVDDELSPCSCEGGVCQQQIGVACQIGVHPGARSSAGEHTLHTGGVTGSIPVAPITESP